MALQVKKENLESIQGAACFTVVDPSCIMLASDGPGQVPSDSIVNDASIQAGSPSTEVEKRRRVRQGMKALPLNLSVTTDAYKAQNRAVADAVLTITSSTLQHDALLRRVNDALSTADDEGAVDFARRCAVLGVLDGTTPGNATLSVLANAVAASSWWEITTNEVRATLVARTATLASKHPGNIEDGLEEQLRALAIDDPALAHAIVQDEDVLDELRDMTRWLRSNPSNPGADANRHLGNLLYDLGLARQGRAPAETIDAARMMARRGLNTIDRICGGLFASSRHRLYDRIAFESP